MEHYYLQYSNGQPQGHGLTQQSQAGPQQQQQQQAVDQTYYQQYEQYQQQYQQYQQYHEYYQYQQQQQMQQQPHQQSSQQVSFLPPSYSTPLPPPKSKQGQHNGLRKPQTANPLSQYQAQYQSAMQKGAAAASAVTAALFQSGYSAPTEPSLTATATAADPSMSSANVASGETEWFSSYQPPTLQQRMAVTMATNTGGYVTHPNQNGRRNNNQRPGQQQKQGRGNNNNQRGKNNNHQKLQLAKEQEKVQEASTDVTDGFHCDACDITFHEEAKLKIHILAHRSCQDCQFSASPSLVAEHRKLTHGPKNDSTSAAAPASCTTATGSGQEASTLPATSPSVAHAKERPRNNEIRPKAPIKSELLHPLAPVLNTPEDITAWIAQRRKAWPTESNILKKEQERKEMIAKGQIVTDSPSKDDNNRNKRKKKQWGQNQGTNPEATVPPTKKAKSGGASESSDITGNGLVEYSSSNNPSDDENEDMDPVKDAVTSKDPSVIGKVLLPGDRPKRPRKPCKFFLKGTCTKGERCSYSHDATQAAKVQKANQASVKKEVFRTRPSLLQMLLSSEIKEEKNKLLEAIRYIVKNNFFEKEEPTGTLVEEVAKKSYT
ncbi:nuclear fragile X mental retardation protein interacting protein 1 [Mortierella sp. GBA30]|nr:nuclear fragile X mental retardation protein interacting protein 1 [Mortierella sp. GBA30]